TKYLGYVATGVIGDAGADRDQAYFRTGAVLTNRAEGDRHPQDAAIDCPSGRRRQSGDPVKDGVLDQQKTIGIADPSAQPLFKLWGSPRRVVQQTLKPLPRIDIRLFGWRVAAGANAQQPGF